MRKKKKDEWYKPTEVDYFFMGFILVLFVLMFSASTCSAQCDSTTKQNEQLKTAIKSLPVDEIINLFGTYDKLLKDCETTKDKISQTAQAGLSESSARISQLQQLLSLSSKEVEELRSELITTKQGIEDLRKSIKKARRKIPLERISTVVLSSVASITIYTILK